MYRQKNKLTGKGVHFKPLGLYKYNVNEYYLAISKYLDTIEKEVS